MFCFVLFFLFQSMSGLLGSMLVCYNENQIFFPSISGCLQKLSILMWSNKTAKETATKEF